MSNVSTARISSGSGSAPPSLTVSPMSSPMATTITRSPIPAIMACDSKHELQPAHRRCSRLNSMSDHSLGFPPSDFGLRFSPSLGYRLLTIGYPVGAARGRLDTDTSPERGDCMKSLRKALHLEEPAHSFQSQLRWYGRPGDNFVVEATTNLTTWSQSITNVLTFHEDGPGTMFWRAKLVP